MSERTPGLLHPGAVAEAVITDDLARRPAHQPDHAAENRALTELAHLLAEQPGNLLQRLVELARGLLRADSVGISVLEPAAWMESSVGTRQLAPIRATAGSRCRATRLRAVSPSSATPPCWSASPRVSSASSAASGPTFTKVFTCRSGCGAT